MQPGESLGVAAQVAVALAGFAGVVVAFTATPYINGQRSTNSGCGV
jgi:hypothetical protein